MQGGPKKTDSPKIAQVTDGEVEAALLKFVAAAETSLVERLPRLSERQRVTAKLMSPRFGVTWDVLQDYAESVFPGISIGSLLRRGDLTLWSTPDQLGGVMRHVPPSLRDALKSSIRQWINGELPTGDPGTVAEAVLSLLEARRIEVRDWLPEPAAPAAPVGPVFRLQREMKGKKKRSKKRNRQPRFALTQRESAALSMHRDEKLTFAEIGRRMGISAERARQLVRSAEKRSEATAKSVGLKRALVLLPPDGTAPATAPED